MGTSSVNIVVNLSSEFQQHQLYCHLSVVRTKQVIDAEVVAIYRLLISTHMTEESSTSIV